ncbi:MAG: hypothetical protein KC636_16775 [Myxococcales bacterium]|nr:hypothetical protein [Myxococcales bacterium]
MAKKAALPLVLGLVLGGCLTQDKVETTIEEANYCDATEDCAVLFPGCPLGCYAYVNKAEVDDVQHEIDVYHTMNGQTCDYDCVETPPVACEAGRCVEDDLATTDAS